MRRPELKAAILTAPFLVLGIVLSLQSLSMMRMKSIETQTAMTTSMERIALSLQGLSYLSSERLKAERDLRALGYLASAKIDYSDGKGILKATFREDGIIALSRNKAYLVFESDYYPLSLEDLALLLSLYPNTAITDAEMDYYELFGFDYNSLEEEVDELSAFSFTSFRNDVNVRDMAILPIPVVKG